MSISFSQLSTILKQQKKKTGKKGKGITGLPTFSNADPKFQQKLRIDDDEDDEGTERGNLPCPPYCGGDPDNIVTCARPPCFVRPDEPDPGCFWGMEFGGECVQQPYVGPCFGGEDADGNCLDDFLIVDEDEPPGPEGTEETDDLFDPWKYRGVTNEHIFYRDGRPKGAEEDIN